ncbi:MAG: hypothetical protein IKO47_14075 [Ruminococcus sp.]|nr:hypothetical protein [Ruminococcus sp.]MBR4628790.1 hypothetical protein [Ruminococcus sp.]
MDFDITRLYEIAGQPGPERGQPPDHGQDHGQSEADTAAISQLQRRADSAKADHERALAVYKKYQQNMIAVSQIQTDIIRGAASGTDTGELLLKAVHAIALMTNDNVFYGTVERALKERKSGDG